MIIGGGIKSIGDKTGEKIAEWKRKAELEKQQAAEKKRLDALNKEAEKKLKEEEERKRKEEEMKKAVSGNIYETFIMQANS